MPDAEPQETRGFERAIVGGVADSAVEGMTVEAIAARPDLKLSS
jgi:hypothetical protein